MSELSEKYQYVSDVLSAMKIEMNDCAQYRHSCSKPDFKRAEESGYLVEYSSMQRKSFAQNEDFVIFYLGKRGKNAHECITVFWKAFYIKSRCESRAGRLPADYPNPDEAEKPGVFLEFQEVPLPPEIHGFSVNWFDGFAQPYRQGGQDYRILEIW